MKKVDAIWFNTVGIARLDDGICVRYYIKNTSGLNEDLDTQDILDWGNTFPSEAGKALFGTNE